MEKITELDLPSSEDVGVQGEIARLKGDLALFSQKHQLLSLESRISRGLDPIGILAASDTAVYAEQIAEKYGCTIEEVERVAVDIQKNGPWGYAEDFKQGVNASLNVWLTLLDANDRAGDSQPEEIARNREMDLTPKEFLSRVQEIKTNLSQAVVSDDPLNEAKKNIFERSKSRFRLDGGVPISEYNDGYVYMAANGYESGIIQDADGLLFVGSKRDIPDEVLESWGLQKELREDRGRQNVVFFANGKNENIIKKLYPGFLIVLSRDFSLAKKIAGNLSAADRPENLGYKIYEPTSLDGGQSDIKRIKPSDRIRGQEAGQDSMDNFYKNLLYWKSSQNFRDSAIRLIREKRAKREKARAKGLPLPVHAVNRADLDERAGKISEKIEQKMEELRFLMDIFKKEMPSLPEGAKKIIDMAGGAGDLAMAAAMEMKTQGRAAEKMTIIDPVPELEEYSRLLVDKMPDSEYLSQIRDYKVASLQEAEITSDSLVFAKHACGDLTDSIIENWCGSESPFLMVMTCCQDKAKSMPARYDIAQTDWEKWCRDSAKTNDAGNEENLAAGKEAMKRLDEARVNFLRRRGFEARLETNENFPKGDVIIARRK